MIRDTLQPQLQWNTNSDLYMRYPSVTFLMTLSLSDLAKYSMNIICASFAKMASIILKRLCIICKFLRIMPLSLPETVDPTWYKILDVHWRAASLVYCNKPNRILTSTQDNTQLISMQNLLHISTGGKFSRYQESKQTCSERSLWNSSILVHNNDQ